MTRCPTCGQEKKLSDPQRDYYFSMLQQFSRNPKMAGVKVEGLHMWLKERFLPMRTVKMPDGTSKMVVGSISRKAGPGKLTMSEFIDKVSAWGAEMGLFEGE